MLENNLLLAVSLIPGVDLIVHDELGRGELEQDTAGFTGIAGGKHF